MDIDLIKENSKKKFNEVALTYEQTSDGKFCARLYPEILKEVKQRKNQFILDVGCGNGIILSLVKEGNTLCGLDLSESMIKQAKIKLSDQADLRVGDAESLPWTNKTFDTVLCTFSFHHYPQPQKVLSEMFRVLKKGGRLIIADPWAPPFLRQVFNWAIRFSRDGDYHVYSQAEIAKLLRSQGFIMTKFKRPTHDTFLLVAGK